MPLLHGDLLRSLHLLRSRLLESSDLSICDVHCCHHIHFSSSGLRRGLTAAPSSSRLPHTSPNIPPHHLRTLIERRNAGHWLPPCSGRTQRGGYCILDVPDTSQMACKCEQHNDHSQHLLVLYGLCCETRLRFVSEEKTWSSSLRTNANHLHHGLSISGHPR